ncbi:MAG TPA: DUF1961 family protein [Rariglobus sp.]
MPNTIPHAPVLGALLALTASIVNAQTSAAPPDDVTASFAALNTQNWRQVFADPGTGDWREQWTLDGKRASVTNTPQGMIFAAGPVPNDDASHAVLWTRRSFLGDVKIEWDYTRLDTINRYVNIVYIQATGVGNPPYSKDITKWAALRQIPYMKLYYEHMNLLHISYAAYPNTGDQTADYVRARRYPTAPGRPFDRINLEPDYHDTGLFVPGETYHFTIIKTARDLFFEVRGDAAQKLFHWSLENVEPVTEGPVGIRHMNTRSARYRNITVSTRPSAE